MTLRDWIPTLPSGWRVLRADAVLDYRKTQAHVADFEQADVFHYSIPSIQEIGDGVVQSGSEIESDKIRLEGGELIVSKLNPRKGCVFLTQRKALPIVCSTEFVPLVAREGCDVRFAFYLYSSVPVREMISSVVQSVTRSHQRADPGDITKIWIPLPTLSQQRAIADYLDRETERLDALVAAKERMLELLAEKRRALITHAVTRGLDPDAPLRDTGIPWLGGIPAHWETPPVYARFAVQLGKMLDEKKIKGLHLAPYLRNVDVQWGAINTLDLPEMDFDEDDRIRYSLKAGDILVCEGGEIGRCALWDGAHPECYYQKALHRLRPVAGSDVAAFFVLAMQTIVSSGQFALQSSAATIQHLPAEKLRVARYPAPPFDEQRAIVAHVSHETAKLDALGLATGRTIALLKERRAALIAAAVTGAIPVERAG